MFGDLAKSFGRNFVMGHVAPALFFCILQAILIELGLLGGVGWGDLFVPNDIASKVSAMLTAAVLLAVLMKAFSLSIIRFYEGYYGQNWAFGLLEWHQRRRYQKLQEDIERLTQQGKPAELKEYELNRGYPNRDNLLPTRLGNILRASEYYVSTMYGIDPITMWPRLVAVLPQSFRDQAEEPEVNVKFALNLSVLSFVASLEFLTMLVFGDPAWASAAIVAFLLLSVVWYRIALGFAAEWGEYIRTAFDLYRYELLKTMHIALPPGPLTLKVERDIWRRVQLVTFYGEDPDNELEFLPGDKEKTGSDAGGRTLESDSHLE